MDSISKVTANRPISKVSGCLVQCVPRSGCLNKDHRWFGTAFWLNVRSSLSRVAREVKSTLVPITNGSIFLDVARICQALTVKDLCKEFVEIVDCMISCAMGLDCWIHW